jgi:hypothetical protein
LRDKRRSKRVVPPRVTLPSGRKVRLSQDALAAAADPGETVAPIARAFAVLAAPRAITDEDGEVIALDDLELRDAHLLRALVLRAGLVEEGPRTFPCHNCGEPVTLTPSEAFEIGPFVDDELDDPELDAPFDFDRRWAIPTVFSDEGAARTIRLAPRTVGEAQVLARANGPLDLSRAVVTALGVRELGRSKTARAIASGLARADDEAWTAIAALWERAHYSPRSLAEVVCACGARNEHPVPADRELDALAPLAEPERPESEVAGFPDEETFARWVRETTKRVFRARGVRNVPVVVDFGVPACDDGGSPLLGCYTPGALEGEGTIGPASPEIRLYYRSFREEKRLDESFDVRAEIEETIDHETEHHLNFLEGDDPVDDEERAVIAKERALVVGKKELTRRAAKGVLADFVGFVRLAFPLLALLVGLSIWRSCVD